MALRSFVGLILLAWATSAASAADKQLASFGSVSELDYYSAWGGSVAVAVDPAVGTEGSSMRLDYSLAAGSGNFVEYLRNYTFRTQDYNFMPDRLSIWIKGNGTTDRFRFQLFEDNNGNGIFQEPGEEVWVWSHSTVLSETLGKRVSMPFANFRLQGGTGNGVLDLHRIGKWRIVIDDRNGVGHGATSAWIDDLRLHNTYTVPTLFKPLSGSFIQIWNDTACACGYWSQAQWTSEFQRMAELGMDTLIVQYGMYDNGAGQTTSFYPSSLGFVTYNQATLDNVMAAAAATGRKVVLGLYFNASWDGDQAWDQAATYTTVESRNKQVIDELWARYNTSSALGGWYIPQEIDDLRWQGVNARNELAGMVQRVAAHAKAKNPALPVMISPFFGMNQPADVYQAWWASFLAAAPSVDWIIPQDGVGTRRTDGDSDVPYYFGAIKAAADAAGRNFGATVESFQQSGSTFEPTTIASLESQLKVAGGFASRIFQFEWSYMQPGLNGPNKQLHNDYRAKLGLAPLP